MFIEIITKRNERVLLNIQHILFVVEYKSSTLLVDIDGNEYYTNEPFNDICLRLNIIKN